MILFRIIYISDSLGSLKKLGIKRIIKLFKKYWFKKMGIHAHDNLSLAISNTKYAYKLGITWLDSTINSMGRTNTKLKN